MSRRKLLVIAPPDSGRFNWPYCGSNFIPTEPSLQSNDAFEGNALMHRAIVGELVRRFPDEVLTRGCRATITGALVSNKTFTAIMEAAGVSVTWEGEGRDWKAAADAFEMMIAQFGRTRGDKTVRDWVGKVFGPLVVVAKRAFDEVTKQAGYDEDVHRKRANDRLSRANDKFAKFCVALKKAPRKIKERRSRKKNPLLMSPIFTTQDA